MKPLPVIFAVGLGIALYGVLLIVAGPIVLLITAGVCFVGCIGWLSHEAAQPVTDQDKALAQADLEITRAEIQARTIRRLARQRARESSPIQHKRGGFSV